MVKNVKIANVVLDGVAELMELIHSFSNAHFNFEDFLFQLCKPGRVRREELVCH